MITIERTTTYPESELGESTTVETFGPYTSLELVGEIVQDMQSLDEEWNAYSPHTIACSYRIVETDAEGEPVAYALAS